MSLSTKSAWIYGLQVTESNNLLDFDEGGPELTAELSVGEYSFTDFLSEIARALNAAGALTYTVTANRSTRIITISAGSAFTLLGATGTHVGNDIFSMMGFAAADTASASSHAGSSASGSLYEPQFYLLDYVDFLDDVQSIDGTLRESTSGKVEAISFGKNYFMSCNIKYITNIKQSSPWIDSDSSALVNARAFLDWCTYKYPLEFMANKSDVDTYTECILESTPESKDGFAYKLKELYGNNLIGYFETGLLRFRKVL